jgi:hypothetical protein
VDITRTSTDSNTIGTGSKTFTYYIPSSNLGWLINTRLRAANDVSNYIEGVVTAVNSTSVTITSDNAVGSGTYISWNITLTGDKGSTGTTGSVTATSDLTLTEVGSSPTTSANEVKLYNLTNVPTVRLESDGAIETITRYNDDLFKYQLMYG